MTRSAILVLVLLLAGSGVWAVPLRSQTEVIFGTDFLRIQDSPQGSNGPHNILPPGPKTILGSATAVLQEDRPLPAQGQARIPVQDPQRRPRNLRLSSRHLGKLDPNDPPSLPSSSVLSAHRDPQPQDSIRRNFYARRTPQELSSVNKVKPSIGKFISRSSSNVRQASNPSQQESTSHLNTNPLEAFNLTQEDYDYYYYNFYMDDFITHDNAQIENIPSNPMVKTENSIISELEVTSQPSTVVTPTPISTSILTTTTTQKTVDISTTPRPSTPTTKQSVSRHRSTTEASEVQSSTTISNTQRSLSNRQETPNRANVDSPQTRIPTRSTRTRTTSRGSSSAQPPASLPRGRKANQVTTKLPDSRDNITPSKTTKLPDMTLLLQSVTTKLPPVITKLPSGTSRVVNKPLQIVLPQENSRSNGDLPKSRVQNNGDSFILPTILPTTTTQSPLKARTSRSSSSRSSGNEEASNSKDQDNSESLVIPTPLPTTTTQISLKVRSSRSRNSTSSSHKSEPQRSNGPRSFRYTTPASKPRILGRGLNQENKLQKTLGSTSSSSVVVEVSVKVPKPVSRDVPPLPSSTTLSPLELTTFPSPLSTNPPPTLTTSSTTRLPSTTDLPSSTTPMPSSSNASESSPIEADVRPESESSTKIGNAITSEQKELTNDDNNSGKTVQADENDDLMTSYLLSDPLIVDLNSAASSSTSSRRHRPDPLRVSPSRRTQSTTSSITTTTTTPTPTTPIPVTSTSSTTTTSIPATTQSMPTTTTKSYDPTTSGTKRPIDTTSTPSPSTTTVKSTTSTTTTTSTTPRTTTSTIPRTTTTTTPRTTTTTTPRTTTTTTPRTTTTTTQSTTTSTTQSTTTTNKSTVGTTTEVISTTIKPPHNTNTTKGDAENEGEVDGLSRGVVEQLQARRGQSRALEVQTSKVEVTGSVASDPHPSSILPAQRSSIISPDDSKNKESPQKGSERLALPASIPQGSTTAGLPIGSPKAQQGISPLGLSPFGEAPAGLTPFGKAPGGVAPQGVVPGGIFPHGVAPQGVVPQGEVMVETDTTKGEAGGLKLVDATVGKDGADANSTVGYVVEEHNLSRFRLEEKTPDGFIIGEYGVVDHSTGDVNGVRYTADSEADPQLIYESLMKFLKL